MNSSDPHSFEPSTKILKTLGAYCDGQITAEELAELEEFVCQSEENQQFYCDYLLLHGELAYNQDSVLLSVETSIENNSIETLEDQEVLSHSTLGFLSNRFGQVGQFMSKPISLSISMAFLVLACILTTLGLFTFSNNSTDVADNTPPKNDPVIAQQSIGMITQLQKCQWGNVASIRKVGDVFVEGELLDLNKGWVEVQFKSGAKAVLEGPLQIKFQSSKSVNLLAGKSTFYVPPAASGFAVDTKSAKVVDIGTEFGVEVERSQATLVKVFKGEVEAEVKNADGVGTGKKHSLTTGDAMRFNFKSQDPQSVPEIKDDHFVRAISSSSYSSMVLSDRPVLYWNFDETMGPAKELSSRNPARSLQPVGGAKRVLHSALSSGLNLGRAADLTGDTDLFMGKFNQPALSSAWAIEMWIQFTKAEPGFTGQYIIHTNPRLPNSSNPSLIFDFKDDESDSVGNELEFHTKNKISRVKKLRTDGGPIINDNQWHHVMLVYYGHDLSDGMDIYYDGKRLKYVRRNGFQADFSFNKLLLGSSRESGGYGLLGRVDELAVYSLHAMEKPAIQKKVESMIQRHRNEATKVTKE